MKRNVWAIEREDTTYLRSLTVFSWAFWASFLWPIFAFTCLSASSYTARIRSVSCFTFLLLACHLDFFPTSSLSLFLFVFNERDSERLKGQSETSALSLGPVMVKWRKGGKGGKLNPGGQDGKLPQISSLLFLIVHSYTCMTVDEAWMVWRHGYKWQIGFLFYSSTNSPYKSLWACATFWYYFLKKGEQGLQFNLIDPRKLVPVLPV